MPPEIRFCPSPAGRIAYATVGSGPPLVIPALWIGHLELEWDFPEYRAFITALARTRTVIRYDRLGTGLSDRDEPRGAGAASAALDLEVATLSAVADALGLDAFSLLGMSWGGATAVAFAARHPRRVRSLAVVGAFAHGEEIAPRALREALVDTVRAHWGAGARALSDVWIPDADADLRARFARLQRAAATPEVAAAALEAIYATDIRELAATVRAPALVVHRRDDRAIPHALGRELAATLPESRFIACDGNVHPPWLGDSAAILAVVREFLDRHDEPPAAPVPAPHDEPAAPARVAGPAGPLSGREREVLQLVAEGLGDPEIAKRLVVSPHTVHRHVANIRTKLGQPTRAAAAAYAARAGLI